MGTPQRLTDEGLIGPPRWLPGHVQYETIMRSVAYGVSSDSGDLDLYGWAIPPKEDIFPQLRGEVLGAGVPGDRPAARRRLLRGISRPSVGKICRHGGGLFQQLGSD